MKKIIIPGLGNIAKLVNPKIKAIIYTIATIILGLLIIASAVIGFIDEFKPEIKLYIIKFLLIGKAICLSFQQSFNGKNIKKITEKKNRGKNNE